MPPKGHALLGASKAYQYIACPPSARLQEGLPDKTSPYAEEGTKAHELCELRLRQLEGNDVYDVKRATANPEGEYPPEMQKAADVYVDFIRDTMAGFTEEPSMFVEQSVNFSGWVPEGFGTCDCVLIADNTLHIIDFKYGAGVPVSAEMNPQMLCYALGAYDLFSATDEINTVRMSIVQPRIKAEPETFELSADAMLEWAETVLRPAAKLAWAGEGERKPGEHCRFCKCYPACPAWKEKYEADLMDGFEDLDRAQLTFEELGKWLERVRGLPKYVKDLEEYALGKLMDGESIPGWKAVAGNGKRVFTDMDAAFKAIMDSGISEDMLYERSPISLTAAEKLVTKKKFAELCGKYITKSTGNPTLVPESDKRPSINRLEGIEEVD